jgi:hypothetical protein
LRSSSRNADRTTKSPIPLCVSASAMALARPRRPLPPAYRPARRRSRPASAPVCLPWSAPPPLRRLATVSRPLTRTLP